MAMIEGPNPFVLFRDEDCTDPMDLAPPAIPSDGAGTQYFQARERAERAAAKAATSSAAIRIHQELAQVYAALARPESGRGR